MAIDTRELRNCLGRFATGVTVVTCEAADGFHGATVNAFSAISLDPPLVLVSLDRRSRACGLLADRSFAVNVLGEDGEDLALQFAGRPRPDLLVDWEPEGNAPRLAAAQAWFVCSPWQQYDGGDHVLYLGEVKEFGHLPGDPLLFHAGQFRFFDETTQPVPWLESGDSPSSTGFLGLPGALSLARQGR
ncbi:flavin reductase family protein [Spirillospora sp. CA-255316]